jgi:hypothetical protein
VNSSLAWTFSPNPSSKATSTAPTGHVDDINNNGSDNNDPDTEGTMPTQAPEASGEVDNLVLSIGVLDPESYVDMRAPWVEGAKGEKVCHSGMVLGAH